MAAASVELDNNGHLYVSGDYAGPSVIFGNGTLPFSGTIGVESNCFITQYDVAAINTAINNPVRATPAITVYPNPSGGRFYFKGIGNGSVLQVYDVLGQPVCQAIAGGDIYALNFTAQARGVYFYRVTNGNALVQQGKIVLE